jgi:FkbM family methyltransferase
MSILSRAKQLSIATGLYKPARSIHRAMFPSERRQFIAARELYSSFIKRGDLAFDVGANIGMRSEAMLSLGAHVVAFEPQEECAAEIAARGNSRLTVVREAVGNKAGIGDFHLKSSTAIGSFLPDWGGNSVGMISVPITTLDAAIVKFGKPLFCKIDVEGFEPEVIEGLSQPIKCMSLEFQTTERGIARVNRYAEKLLSFGRCEINFTAHEENQLRSDQWTPGDAFFRSFSRLVDQAAYGDLFVRYSDF